MGLGYFEQALVAEELSKASGALGLSYVVHAHSTVDLLRVNGTAEQRAKYLPALVSGDKVGSLAMSEAGAGSDVMAMALRADK